MIEAETREQRLRRGIESALQEIKRVQAAEEQMRSTGIPVPESYAGMTRDASDFVIHATIALYGPEQDTTGTS